MFIPGFVQPRGGGLEDFGEDVNNQDREKSAIQTDGQPGPEKVIAHDDNQDQDCRDEETVVHRHFSQTVLSPPLRRKPFIMIVSLCKLKRYIFDSTNIAYSYMAVNINFTEVCIFIVYS